ncbi:MAG: VOC family protein [Gammaproteobacteria bacterium]|nr:MAG: VOC family protein [Gammaproteobacteria bacterium]
MQTAPHVNFKGNCREAFNFYAETFGGRIVFAMTYGEAPGSENAPAEVRRQIIHARVDFGGQYLLGCDAPADRYQAPQGFAVMAAVEKPADAERIFKALAESGTICMPFQETFWAHGFGMCTDRFGTPWMVNCAKSPEAVEAVRGRSSASAGRA